MSGLQAGAARAVINPPLGAKKGGMRLFADPIESVDDDIEIAVLVLSSAGATVAIVSSDLGNATLQEAAEIRDCVAEILRTPRSHILFNCSHNHSAPTLPGNNGNTGNQDDLATCLDYYRMLLDQVAACTRAALADLRESRFAVGWGSADLNVYRREWRDGQDILGEVPGHPTDQSVGVLRVDDLAGRAIATVFRYSCHPVVNGAQAPTLSADFPGSAKRIVEQKVGGVALFLQGCGGNINPSVGIGYERDCTESVYRMGTALGAEAVRVAMGLNTHRRQDERVQLNGVPNVLFKPWIPVHEDCEVLVAGAEEIIRLGYSPLPDAEFMRSEELRWRSEINERLARGAFDWEVRVARAFHTWCLRVLEAIDDPDPACDFVAQALRVGDVAFVGLSVEAFFETGQQIQAESPFGHTFVSGYTNGTTMYLPRKEDYPVDGWVWPNTHALPDLLPQVYCQPALWHPDSEQQAVAAAVLALQRLT